MLIGYFTTRSESCRSISFRVSTVRALVEPFFGPDDERWSAGVFLIERGRGLAAYANRVFPDDTAVRSNFPSSRYQRPAVLSDPVCDVYTQRAPFGKNTTIANCLGEKMSRYK